MIFSVLIDHSKCNDEQWAGWCKAVDGDIRSFGGRGVVEELSVHAVTAGCAMEVVHRSFGDRPIRIIYCKAQPHLVKENERVCAGD